MKKLYRSRTNKVWGGVLGGLGEYTEVDPVLLRLAFAFIVIASGVVPGVIAYIVALVIVPVHPSHTTDHNPQS